MVPYIGTAMSPKLKTTRLEARLTPAQRSQIDHAAALSGLSTSSFVVEAAVERADSVVSENASTVVPAEYFDDLLAALDRPEEAPELNRAAQRAKQASRIVSP